MNVALRLRDGDAISGTFPDAQDVITCMHNDIYKKLKKIILYVDMYDPFKIKIEHVLF